MHSKELINSAVHRHEARFRAVRPRSLHTTCTQPRQDILPDALSSPLLGRQLAGCDGRAIAALFGVLSCRG